MSHAVLTFQSVLPNLNVTHASGRTEHYEEFVVRDFLKRELMLESRVGPDERCHLMSLGSKRTDLNCMPGAL